MFLRHANVAEEKREMMGLIKQGDMLASVVLVSNIPKERISRAHRHDIQRMPILSPSGYTGPGFAPAILPRTRAVIRDETRMYQR
jgi:hypothetical protein